MQTKKNECVVCYKSETTLFRCTKCSWVNYCSTDCQKMDWNMHKNVCSKFDKTTLTLLNTNTESVKSFLSLDKSYIKYLSGKLGEDEAICMVASWKEFSSINIKELENHWVIMSRSFIINSHDKKKILKDSEVNLVKSNPNKKMLCVIVTDSKGTVWSKVVLVEPIEQTKRIICLSGVRNVGKDTFGNALSKHINYTCYALADILKLECASKLGVDVKHFYYSKEDPIMKHFNNEDVKKKCIEILVEANNSSSNWAKDLKNKKFDEVTFRDVLIYESSVMKSHNLNIFVQSLIDNSRDVDDIIITDVSFEHEITFLKNLFNNVVHIYIENDVKNTIFDNREIKKEKCDITLFNDFTKPFNFDKMFEKLTTLDKFKKFYKTK